MTYGMRGTYKDKLFAGALTEMITWAEVSVLGLRNVSGHTVAYSSDEAGDSLYRVHTMTLKNMGRHTVA